MTHPTKRSTVGRRAPRAPSGSELGRGIIRASRTIREHLIEKVRWRSFMRQLNSEIEKNRVSEIEREHTQAHTQTPTFHHHHF
jgi:hypothetical protein